MNLGRRSPLLFPHPILDLVLAAPAFDFEVVEDLAHGAAEQAFEVGVVDVLEALHGGLFVGLEEEQALV